MGKKSSLVWCSYYDTYILLQYTQKREIARPSFPPIPFLKTVSPPSLQISAAGSYQPIASPAPARGPVSKHRPCKGHDETRLLRFTFLLTESFKQPDILWWPRSSSPLRRCFPKKKLELLCEVGGGHRCDTPRFEPIPMQK